MWNNAVSYVYTSLQTALRPLAAMAHDHPVTVVGIALIFALLAAMLAAEIVDGRAAARIDEASRAD